MPHAGHSRDVAVIAECNHLMRRRENERARLEIVATLNKGNVKEIR